MIKWNIIKNWFFWRWTVIICKYNSADKMYENAMEGELACTGKRKVNAGWWGTWRNDTTWNRDVKKRIILKRILKDQGAKAWAGLIWLNTWTDGGLLWKRQWTFGFHKMRRVAGETISFWRGTLLHAVSSYLTKSVDAAYRNKIAICCLNKSQHSYTHIVGSMLSFTKGYKPDSNSWHFYFIRKRYVI